MYRWLSCSCLMSKCIICSRDLKKYNNEVFLRYVDKDGNESVFQCLDCCDEFYNTKPEKEGGWCVQKYEDGVLKTWN